LDYDKILVDYCLQEFYKQTGIDLRTNIVAQLRVREAAEQAKIILSTIQFTTVDVPYIYGDQTGIYNLSVPLSRIRFNELTYHLVERSIECCQKTLKDSGIPSGEISHLVLVGLSTKTPSVYDTVSKFFGIKPVPGIDPDRVVALGAARQAGVLSGSVTDFLLLNATSFTISIETVGDVATPLIVRNTTIPLKNYRPDIGEEPPIFTTVKDNQTHALINIVQGEASRASDNLLLTSFILASIPPAPRGIPRIEIIVDVDANGLIDVIARDKDTKRERAIMIDKSNPLFETLPTGVICDVLEKSEKLKPKFTAR
jgi:molecular chaperone DnaK